MGYGKGYIGCMAEDLKNECLGVSHFWLILKPGQSVGTNLTIYRYTHNLSITHIQTYNTKLH